MVSATSEALGLKAMLADYDAWLNPWLFVDASAAIGVAQRSGLGKIRHLDTGTLWLQQAVKEKQLGIAKVKGTENPSDLMTKFTDLATLEKFCAIMNLETRGGRATLAPKVAEDARGESEPGWTEEVVADVSAVDEVSDDDIAEDDCKVTELDRIH